MNKTKAIPIYIRVSSDDQVQGTSLDTQLRDCRAAALRDGFDVGEVFADEGESAKTIENRPAFLRLLDYIKANGSPAVMVHKIDRFARNNLEAQIVRARLEKLGCRLLSATERISDDPSGKFMFDVLSAVAEYDNRVRAERCRRGMVSQAEEGWWVTTPPIGYVGCRTDTNKPSLALDEERAPHIANAFEMAAGGMTQVDILNHLTMKGLTTRAGKAVTKQTLSRILANPAYAGLAKNSLVPGKLVDGKWPAIISRDLYNRARDKSLVGLRPRHAPGRFPLRGLISCGDCGKKLTASASSARGIKYEYYHCPACGLRFPAMDVESAVRAAISELTMDKACLDVLEDMVHELMKRDYPSAQQEKERAARKVVAIEDKLDRLIELRLTDGISREMYDRKKGDLDEKLYLARQHLGLLEGAKFNLIKEFERARQLLMDPGTYWHTAGTKDKQASFPLFFDGPVKLSWKNKKIGTIQVDGSNCLIWYTRRDSNSRPPV